MIKKAESLNPGEHAEVVRIREALEEYVARGCPQDDPWWAEQQPVVENFLLSLSGNQGRPQSGSSSSNSGAGGANGRQRRSASQVPALETRKNIMLGIPCTWGACGKFSDNSGPLKG